MGTAATVAAFACGLLLTLLLAARFTPRSWWRRANAGAGAFLAAGTLLIGGALLLVLGPPAPANAVPYTLAAKRGQWEPVPGGVYVAWDNLNLRASRGVSARRMAVVPAGASVTATGERKGDWWEVSARFDGREERGWVSSLWLRRIEEARR